MRAFSIVLCIFAASFAVVSAQQKEATPNVKIVPITPTAASSAKDMFMNYCASCHGKEGKGDGPAAPAMKTPPTDLTLLAAHNGGKFPEDRVFYSLQGGVVPAHGSEEMPVWGDVLKSLNAGSSNLLHLRLTNLTYYIRDLQKK
jgi:mono/diheme cytochrome c family protein